MITQTGPKISSLEIWNQVNANDVESGFLGRYPHIRLDISKDVRLNEISVISGSGSFTDDEFCSLLLA
jgi:4-diphosphocytidyl-2C-methyl-D-erythritol kinase